MNQDFLFDASPRVARHLVRLSEIANIDLDDAIREMASQDLISQEAYLGIPKRFQEAEYAAIQRLVDHAMRAVLVVNRFSSYQAVVLAAAKISGIRPIVLALDSTMGWENAARLMGMTVGHNPNADTDVLIVSMTDMPSPEIATEERRAGLLVVDSPSDPFGMSPAKCASEFPNTIVLVTPTASDWFKSAEVAMAANLLHGSVPSNALIHNQFNRRSILQPRGFKRHHPVDLSFLFTVVHDLVDDKTSPITA